MRVKGWEERGPKAHSKTQILIPLWFRYSLVAFQKVSMFSQKNVAFSRTGLRIGLISEGAEHGFGEYGFKRRTQWVFWPSPSSGGRTQWVPLGLLFVCQSELTEFFAELTEFAAKLSEAQWALSPKQYSRNSIPPVSYCFGLLERLLKNCLQELLLWCESLALVGDHTAATKTQKLVLRDPAFIVLWFEPRDWRSSA